MDKKPLLNALKNILTEENFKKFKEMYGKDTKMMSYMLSLYHHKFNRDSEKLNTYFEIIIGKKKPENQEIVKAIEGIDEIIKCKERDIELLKKIKRKVILAGIINEDWNSRNSEK